MPEDREWDPSLLALRRQIERRFEAELRDAATEIVAGVPDGGDLGQRLLDLAAADNGPSIASFLQRHATREQLQDYLRERSIQQLKEADPHSFVLPRLDGPAKVALAELQFDEYGGGRPERLHARLYAQAGSARDTRRTAVRNAHGAGSARLAYGAWHAAPGHRQHAHVDAAGQPRRGGARQDHTSSSRHGRTSATTLQSLTTGCPNSSS